MFEHDEVALGDLLAGVGEALGEVAVGGEDDEALGVFVEAAGAEKAVFGEFGREKGEDRLGVVRVVVGADEAAGFVHGDGDFRLHGGGADLTAVDDDFIRGGVDFLAEFGGAAVYPDFSLRD